MTQIIIWLNELANGVASVFLAPLALLPGWVSATLVAAATGVVMLLAFKATSNQEAVKHVRNNIKANLLALSLFKDNVVVSLRCQGRIVVAAGHLLALSLVPMLAMCVPMVLLLGQLAVWYQARPLHRGEEAVITVHLSATSDEAIPEVRLVPCSAIEPTAGPVRVAKEHMICWNVRAVEAGYHQLQFESDGQTYEKELAIGNGFMRVSLQRPRSHWSDVVLHPRETPFPAESPVQAVEVAYPKRVSWAAGSNSWVVYWFVASMGFAFALRPVLKVNL